MMSCRELTELITEYLDGALPFGRKLQFQLHLGLCRHCRTYLRQLRKTVSVLGHVPDVEQSLPAPVRDELLQRFRTWKRPN
jgi:anti-sigma factor RsiW